MTDGVAEPLQPGLADHGEVVNYVDGECHFFALAVYDLIGYSPAYVANRGRNGHQAVGHVVIALPDGHVADAEGIWCTRDLLTHWGAAEIISTTPEEVRSDLSDEDGVLSDHCMERIARARRILQQDEQTYLARLASVTASVGEPEQEDGQPRP